MLTLKHRKITAKRFTLVELLAVITITTILLGITLRVMKTDSTKANVSTLGSALSYARSYSITSLKTDGTQTLKVTVTKNSVTLTMEDSAATPATTVIKEEKLAFGSTISQIGATNVTDSTSEDFVYNHKGEPDINSEVIFKIEDNKNSQNFLEVKLKPFTGKVTYY